MPFSIINDYRKPKKCFKNWIRNRNLTLHFLNTVYSESPHTNLGCHEWSGCNGIGLKQRPDIYTVAFALSVTGLKQRPDIYSIASALSVTGLKQRPDIYTMHCIRSVRAKSDTKIRHTEYRCIRYVRDTKNRHIPLHSLCP